MVNAKHYPSEQTAGENGTNAGDVVTFVVEGTRVSPQAKTLVAPDALPI
jgi:hypothetical protein